MSVYAENRDQAADRLGDLEKELAEAIDTIDRFRDRFRSAEKQIAKARKLYRDGDLADAYLALDWRQR